MAESAVTMSDGSSQLQTGDKFLRVLPDENDAKNISDRGVASDIVPDGHCTLEELLIGLSYPAVARTGLCLCILLRVLGSRFMCMYSKLQQHIPQ